MTASSTRVVFATPNQGYQDDLRRLLADVEVVLSRFGPAVPEGLDLAAAATWRAKAAFAALGERCFVENTGLEVEGEPPWRGRDVKALLEEVGEAGFCARYGGRAAVSRVVVALCEHAAGVTLFEGVLDGRIAPAPRGAAETRGRGWDRVFVPDGYVRTFAELGASTYLVNMRHQPYLELADHLRGRTYGGAFEAHVTVRCAAVDAARFAASCDRLEVKHIEIELAHGEHVTQPMTATVHRGDLREVQEEVHELARALVADGFEVVRTKIEALPRNRDLPETDEAARAEPARYFEYHLKLVVPPGGDLAPVHEVASIHGARLSRNARRTRADGGHERYLTLRLPGLGRGSADARFAALEAAVEALPVTIGRRVREYTVYDSNLALDRGWH
ncbi:MAG TPA: non-canonical purine NTP pyrophosphatase [Kofleriaceae bacterium]|nr:non-canonical purine NTP pyrophosphatase [Kofleriaceae bacterium]